MKTALSPRETQVMREMAKGCRVCDIALRMNLSVKTISTYRTRICEKMGIHGVHELLVYAIQHQEEIEQDSQPITAQ